MSAPLTSEQVNYLVWRYLQESGFEKSTFSFQDDCRAQYLEEKFKSWVKPGALIHIIQKGLQYLALEASIYENGTTRSNKVFSFFGPTKIQEMEQKPAAPTKAEVMHDMQGDIVMENTPPPEETNGISVEMEAQRAELLREPPQSNGTVTPIKRSHEDSVIAGLERPATFNQRTKRAKTVAAGDENAMVIDGIGLPDTTSEEVRATIGNSVGVQADECIQLDYESMGVHHLTLKDTSVDGTAKTCSFSPVDTNSIAVSFESCHMFNLSDDLFKPNPKIGETALYQKFGDQVTAIAWSENGEYLATASLGGLIKIWDSRGQLRQSLNVHRAAILTMKFHPAQHNLLLSVDGHSKVMIWDVGSGKMKKSFELAQTNPDKKTTPMDADWIDEFNVVAVGEGGSVERFDMSGLSTPSPQQQDFAMKYEGHDAHKAVKFVIWSTGHETFATAGEDTRIFLWKTKQQKPEAVLEGHTAEIHQLRWSHRSNDRESLLASASEDGTARIWNVEGRICLHVLSMHSSPVSTLSFTGDGKFLATGSGGLIVMVWLTETGQLVGIYDAKRPDGEVSDNSTMEDLSWDKNGDKLAVVADQKCAIIDWRTLWNDATSRKAR